MFNRSGDPRAIAAPVDPQISKDLVEYTLIREYHWTPQQVRELPFAWVQKHMLFKSVENGVMEAKRAQVEAQNKSAPQKPGTKTFREI